MAKPNYPSGLKRRVSGDWNCHKCNNLNFAFRFSCNKCHTEKREENQSLFNSALFMDFTDFEVTSKKENQDTAFDFMNQRIQAQPLTNLSLNIGPKIVNGEKITRDNSHVETIMSQVKRPDSGRQGDWVCLKCKNLNFAFRKDCNKCRAKKQNYIAL